MKEGILEAERSVWDRLSNILKERIEELGVRDSLEPFVRWFGEYDPATGKQRRYSKSFRLKVEAEEFQAVCFLN